MPVLSILNKKIFIFTFFLIFFILGVYIFPNYGISIDEDNTRDIGFLSLEAILKVFAPEYLPSVFEIAGKKLEHPDLSIVPSSGIVFDLPMAFLEYIFEIKDSRDYYLLRHFLNFTIYRS